MIKKHYWSIVLTVSALLFCVRPGNSQSALGKSLPLIPKSYTAAELIEELELVHDIILSFNGRGIDLDRKVSVRSTPIDVSAVLEVVFAGYNYDVISATDRKILLSFSDIPDGAITTIVKGKIYDKLTGEIVVSAIIYERYSGRSTFSNAYGFYSLEVPIDSMQLQAGILGYRDTVITAKPNGLLDIYLNFDNAIGTVVISHKSVKDDYLMDNGSERLDLNSSNGSGVSGQQDVVDLTRSLPGVQSGNEGQTGYYVRGGSPDQNLTLLDGIPLYEISHVAGLSSIFINEAIRDANFTKNGYPARYAGRINSVLDITVKEGNKSDFHGTVGTDRTAARIQMEGPLGSGNTSFNIAGRRSIMDLYLPELYTRYTSYDNIEIVYHDMLAKVTHNFSPLSKLMVTYYDGKDDFDLARTENFQQDNRRFDSHLNNTLSWGTRLLNAQFSNVLSDQFFLNFSLGGSRYLYNSDNEYEFNTVFGEVLSNDYYRLGTVTEIVDYMASFTGEYFANEHHRLKFGGTYTVHTFKPEIQQTSIKIDSTMIDTMGLEQSVVSDEYGLYIEDTYTASEQLQFYMGLHLSGYRIGTQRYRHLQPRLRVVYQPSLFDRVDLSYARTAQYSHLLVNPGTGLPSELWVPATEVIEPQTADQVSVGYTRKLAGGLRLHVGAFLKQMNNVLDYRNPVNLVFAVLNEIPTIDTAPWEDRVVAGQSNARGLEAEVSYTSNLWESKLSYTWSKTTRTFEDINGGIAFPFKYDRRHDISASVSRALSERFTVGANWVYGDGNYFTLSIEEVQTIPGVPIIIPGERNNRRFPAFHHLDLQISYQVRYGEYKRLKVDFGLYNSYNRLNSFYLYLFQNPVDGSRIFRKVSIFPTLPQINIAYQF